MSRKLFNICFAIEYASVLLTALAFWFLTRDGHFSFEAAALSPKFTYAFGLCCALFTLAAAFLSIRQTHWNPLFRLALLVTPAIMVLVDYFLLQESNMLYCLPLLVVASFVMLYKENQN